MRPDSLNLKNKFLGMNFFYYLFYRLKSLHKYRNSSDSWMEAFILIGLLLLIHILTLLLFAQSIIKKDFISTIRIDNGIMDRFVLFPLLVAPIYIILFVFYRVKREDIINAMKKFKNETISERKRNGRYVLFYLVISVLLLFTSMISPIVFK